MKKRFQIKIHPVSTILLIMAFLFLPGSYVFAVACALFWHEGAHAAAFLLCGVTQCNIEVTPFGCMADAKSYDKLTPIKQMISAGAGIAASALGMTICWVTPVKTPLIACLFTAHASLLFVNCMPVWPLDGARVIIAIAALWGKQHAAQKVLRVIAYFVGAIFVVSGVYGVWKGYVNVSLLCAGPYLWHAARQGSLAQKVRNIQYSQHKLANAELLPVECYACCSGEGIGKISQHMAQLSPAKYHIFLEVDPATGEISNGWTENQMLQMFFDRPCESAVSNCHAENVDKVQRL